MRLVGEQVVLRRARPEDADALAQGFADDPTLGAMLGTDPEQENAEWLRSTFPEDGKNDEKPDAYWFVIVHPESDELIGEIGLVDISWPDRRAGLSILVLPVVVPGSHARRSSYWCDGLRANSVCIG